ncbi:MAG: hypothetical protein V4548_01020 [Bacteroidota bacterium]
MKKISFTLFFFSTLLFSCSSYKTINENDRLTAAINSKSFITFFRICESKKDTIKVYNNVEGFIDCPSVKLDCNKIIVIEKSKITTNVNTSSQNPEDLDKIVLFNFVKIKNKYKLSFLHIPSNGALDLIFDKNNKLDHFAEGAF